MDTKNGKLIVKQLILNFKHVLKNKINIFLCLAMIFTALFISIIFVPLRLGAGLIYSIAILPICGIIYSSIYFNVRKSTMYKNISLTKSNRWTFNIAALITIIISSILCSIIIYFSLVFLSNHDLTLMKWMEYSDHESVSHNKIYSFSGDLFLLVVWASIMFALITFSISFMLNHIIKDQKTYFIIIVSLTIVLVIFGGTLNNYFGIGDEGVRDLENVLFPWNLYWVGVIFPYFNPSTLINVGYDAYKLEYLTRDGELVWTIPSGWKDTWDNLFNYIYFNPNNSINWKVQMIFPWIEMTIFIFVGVINSKILRKK